MNKTLKTTSDFTTALTSALFFLLNRLSILTCNTVPSSPKSYGHWRTTSDEWGTMHSLPMVSFLQDVRTLLLALLLILKFPNGNRIWCPIAMPSFSLYIANELTGRLFAGRDRPRQQSEPGRLERGHLNSANRTHWKAFGTLSDVQLGVHIRICIPQAPLLGSNNYRLGHIGGYGPVGSNSYNFPSQPPTPPLCALIDGHAPSSTCTPLAFEHIYPPGRVGIPEGYPQCWVGTLTAYKRQY